MGILREQWKQFVILLMEEPCGCRLDEVYPDGNMPEWYENPKDVVLSMLVQRQRFVSLKEQGKDEEAAWRYFALHLGDRHVLKVLDRKHALL